MIYSLSSTDKKIINKTLSLGSDVYQLVLSFSEHPTSKTDKLEPAKKKRKKPYPIRPAMTLVLLIWLYVKLYFVLRNIEKGLWRLTGGSVLNFRNLGWHQPHPSACSRDTDSIRNCVRLRISLDDSGLNLLKTKRRKLHLKTQFVSRSKHFSNRL